MENEVKEAKYPHLVTQNNRYIQLKMLCMFMVARENTKHMGIPFNTKIERIYPSEV